MLPLTLVAAVVVAIPVRPALAADRTQAAAVKPFMVLASPVTVASGVVVAAGASANIPVDSIPPTGVTAVAVHVTVTERSERGVKKVPSGTLAIAPWTSPALSGTGEGSTATRSAATPAVSPAQLVAYRETGTASGFGVIGVASDTLRVTNNGKAPVTVGVQVEGYAGSGGAVVPLATPRTLSPGTAIGAWQRESLAVTGVPVRNVAGLLVELTASASAAGQLRGAGSGALLDYATGSTISGLALMSESRGRITLGNESAHAARVSAVIVGYLSDTRAADGGPLTTVTPALITSSPLTVAAHGTISVPLAGRGGIPAAGVAGAAVGISATLTGPGHSALVSVGLANSAASATVCPASSGTCTGFAVDRLSGPASDGAVLVHNFSGRAALVTLSAFGYLSEPTVPSAPTALTVKARGGSALLSWHPPASGGTGITGYAVTVSPGGRHLTVSGRKPAVTIPGVSRDVTSTFTVAAVNATGRGAAAVARLVPAGTPAAPGKISARADGHGRFLVTWTAAVTRGARITGYTVTAEPSRVRVAVSASATSAVVTSLAGGAAYLPCVTATSATGATAQSCAGPLLVGAGGAVAQAAAVTPGSSFTPVSPVRLMDTRKGTGGVTGPVAATKSVSLQVAGVDGVPSSGVTAVVMNVTVTAPTGGGVLTVYPDGGSVPAVSNLNFSAGETIPNLVTVELGSDGKVDFYNDSGGTVQVIADLAGYYVAPLSAPTGVTSAAGNAQATVSWAAPQWDGGSAITGYTVTASNGATISAAATATSATVTGLTNGTAYTFTVTAANSTGTGPASVASNAVTPSAPPGAPTGVTATAGNGQATVTWTVPASTGGGAITSYTVAASPGSATLTVAGTVTTATVTGLTNGTSYTFTVTAATVGGSGPVSVASNAVTPATVAGAPTGVTATAGNGQATVTWKAPASNGGSAITGYTVTASNDTTASAAATATSATVTGLTNGTAYTFTVTAINAAGVSASSAASNAVTPVGPPEAPDFTSWTVGNGQVTLDWSAPASDGGEAVTGYTITMEPGGTTYSEAATATSLTITSLTDGTSYSFTIAAINAAGTGPASDPLGPVIPITVPGAPTAVTATAASGSATVTWTAPATEGSQVTGYTVTSAPGGVSVTVPGTASAATVTGLTNGTAYTFTVTATDAAGTGAASAASAAVTPGPVPGPPTDVQATTGNATAAVTWAAPASAGGSAITSYIVTAEPGGATETVSGTTLTANFTGLTNNTTYQFTVVAVNSYGDSASSGSSAAVMPTAPAAPDAPFITNVTGEDSAVDVTWSPPDTGAADLTGYVITTSAGSTTVSTTSEPATATEATVTGLTNGTQYTFTIAALNATGTGASSPASVPVAPLPATAPMAPANVVAVPQNGQLQVGWGAPPDGGSPLTGYTVTISPATVGAISVAGNTTVATVTGLTNGTAYTVSVTATNTAGISPAGQAGPATPEAVIAPGAPVNVAGSVTASGTVSVSWTPPMDPGTATITGYTVTASTGTTVAASTSACTGTPARCTASVSGLTASTAYTFTVTATSSAGTSPASTATDAITPTLTVASAPVVLSAADAARLRYVNTDGTLVFEQPSSAVTGLTTGGLVYVPATSVDADGFLGKVDSVTTTGGLVYVATSPANLPDVYSAYNASMDVPFNGADAQLVNAVPGVSISRPEIGGKAITSSAASRAVSPEDSPVSVSFDNDSMVIAIDADLAQGDSEDGSASTPSVSPAAHLEGTLTLTPILHLNLHGGTLGFTVGANLDAHVDTKVGVEVSTTEKIFLGKVMGPTVDVQVGEIPVPSKVVFTFYAVLTASGTIGIEYQADYSHTLAAVCQVSLTGGSNGCSPDNADDSDSGGVSAGHTIYGAMTASAGLQIGASLQIAFVAGPEVDLTPQVQITADTSANPWWTLDLLGTLGVAVTMNEVWGNGDTIYSDPNLFTFGPLNLANAGGPLTGLEISPGQASLYPGSIQQFSAYDYNEGTDSPVTATWSVVAGPGSISSSGVFAAPSSAGVSIVEATYNGLPARASVVTGSPLWADNVSGNLAGAQSLVDAAEVEWTYQGTVPSGFAVTTQPDGTPANASGEVVYVSGTVTRAYLPNLLPGVNYTVTVYAVGTGGGILGTESGVVAYSPLPRTGDAFDIATNPTTGKPDDSGQAGSDGQVAISGNGEYAFFYTQATSNLAPASIFFQGSTAVYLLRKNLFTGEIDVASIGLDGHTPVSADDSHLYPKMLTNSDGSAVVFYVINSDGYDQPEVYDFTTQTGRLIGSADDQDTVDGISTNGLVVAYTSGFGGIPYRQAEGGAAQLLDNCSLSTPATCVDVGPISMSDDGNLIAHLVQDTSQSSPTFGSYDIYLYNAGTGTDTAVFPRSVCHLVGYYQCDDYMNPVLSGDGSTLAFEWKGFWGSDFQLALTRAGSQGMIAVATDDVSDSYEPLDLSDNGDALLYSDSYDTSAIAQTELLLYGNGVSQAPQLSGAPQTTLESASLAGDGSEALYTLHIPGVGGYPGVYLWRP